MAVIARGQVTIHIAEKGDPGESKHIHIRYSANSNGNPMVTTPSTFIGFAVTTSATAPTTNNSYTWSRLQGLPGSNGLPGTSSYLHIRYSKNANGSPMVNTPDTYIGTVVNNSATAPTSYTAYTWSRFQTDSDSLSTGRMLFRDPEFRKGYNLLSRYNNGVNATGNRDDVTVTRISRPEDCPTTSTHCIEISVIGSATSPGLGGFVQIVYTRPNAVFIQKIIAKFPVGFTIGAASNSVGTGGSHNVWLTSQQGTGKYETYLRKITCGTEGTFSTTGHVFLNGPVQSYPFKWYVAMATVYDMTDSEKYDDEIEDAKAPRALLFRGEFSDSVVYYNNKNRRDVVKRSNVYYIYKGTDAVAGAWVAANWENFGSTFTSVATGLLLAELAYIQNLGVANLRTRTTGQRIEINESTNSMAFYDGKRSYPIVEVKSSNDALHNGEGAGLFVRQPDTQISVTNGIYVYGGSRSGLLISGAPSFAKGGMLALQSIFGGFTNEVKNKYKVGLYIDIQGLQGVVTNSDRAMGIYVRQGGIYIGSGLRYNWANNVLAGVTCAGRVSATGVLERSWVQSLMGGYLSCTRRSTGTYRISFSVARYLYPEYYYVMIFPEAYSSGGNMTPTSGAPIYKCDTYFDVFLGQGSVARDVPFMFLVMQNNIFFS